MQPFKIYYRNKPPFTWRSGSLPSGEAVEGVYGVVFNDSRQPGNHKHEGAVPLTRWNFYVYSDLSGWSGCDTWGELKSHLRYGLGEGGVRLILYGIQGWSEDFDKVEREMWRDTEFGPRSVTHAKGMMGDN